MVGHHAKMVWADVQDKVSAVVQEYCEHVAVAHELGFITRREAVSMLAQLGIVEMVMRQEILGNTAESTTGDSEG